MSRWDQPLPPTRFARWIARHLRAVQLVSCVIALACAALAVSAFRSDGWSSRMVAPALQVFVFGTFPFVAKGIAASVVTYDRRSGDTEG
jgi:hypothetical protein